MNTKFSLLFIVAVAMVLVFSGSSVLADADVDEPVLENNNYFISVVDSISVTDSVVMIKN